MFEGFVQGFYEEEEAPVVVAQGLLPAEVREVDQHELENLQRPFVPSFKIRAFLGAVD